MPFEQYISEHRMEPTVYLCGIDKNIKPGTRYGPVIRDIFLVECCTAGYGTIIINGREYPITPRCAYFLFPGDSVTHVTSEVEPREGYFAAIDGLQISGVLKKLGISSEQPFAPSELFDEINAHVRELYMTRDEVDMGADYRRTAHVYAILGALMRRTPGTNKSATVQKAIGYMEANYPDDISVAAVAQELGLDRSYFSSLFKEQTGTSPHAYLNYIRIKKAAFLMRDGGYSIAEIAEAVGLNLQNFSRIFRRELNMTPSEYRASISADASIDVRAKRPVK